MAQTASHPNYIRFSWANDALKLRGITDRYFTNGNTLEYFFTPGNPDRWAKLFLKMPDSVSRNNSFAVSVSQSMFTPTDISKSEILLNDRPYAGWLYVSIKCISNSYEVAQRFTTEYSVGLIGPNARQKEVQTWFHKSVVPSTKPMGWDNQIANDIGLNVRADYERGLNLPSPYMEMIGLVESNFGTVTNYMGLGSMIRIGRFNDYFTNELGLRDINKTDVTKTLNRQRFNRNLQLFLAVRASMRAVIDNSLLQGGIFSYDSSPYRLSSDDIKRFYFHGEFSLNIIFKGVGFIYAQNFRTPEFNGAVDTTWGSVTLIGKVGK